MRRVLLALAALTIVLTTAGAPSNTGEPTVVAIVVSPGSTNNLRYAIDDQGRLFQNGGIPDVTGNWLLLGQAPAGTPRSMSYNGFGNLLWIVMQNGDAYSVRPDVLPLVFESDGNVFESTPVQVRPKTWSATKNSYR